MFSGQSHSSNVQDMENVMFTEFSSKPFEVIFQDTAFTDNIISHEAGGGGQYHEDHNRPVLCWGQVWRGHFFKV